MNINKNTLNTLSLLSATIAAMAYMFTSNTISLGISLFFLIASITYSFIAFKSTEEKQKTSKEHDAISTKLKIKEMESLLLKKGMALHKETQDKELLIAYKTTSVNLIAILKLLSKSSPDSALFYAIQNIACNYLPQKILNNHLHSNHDATRISDNISQIHHCLNNIQKELDVVKNMLEGNTMIDFEIKGKVLLGQFNTPPSDTGRH